jgi:hypothetical protein
MFRTFVASLKSMVNHVIANEILLMLLYTTIVKETNTYHDSNNNWSNDDATWY